MSLIFQIVLKLITILLATVSAKLGIANPDTKSAAVAITTGILSVGGVVWGIVIAWVKSKQIKQAEAIQPGITNLKTGGQPNA